MDPFVTVQMNAPTGVNLTWNSWMPAIGLVLAPVTVTAGPIVAYNAALTGSIALSSLAAFVALRRYASGWAGPLAGGAVYGFSPYLFSHAALHLNLVAAWIPPLALVVLDELLVRRRRGPVPLGAALGVLAGVQMLVFEELVATGAVAPRCSRGCWPHGPRPGAIARAPGGCRRSSPRWPACSSVAACRSRSSSWAAPDRRPGTGHRLFSTDLLNVVLPTRYQQFAPDAATRISPPFSGLYHEATAYLACRCW